MNGAHRRQGGPARRSFWLVALLAVLASTLAGAPASPASAAPTPPIRGVSAAGLTGLIAFAEPTDAGWCTRTTNIKTYNTVTGEVRTLTGGTHPSFSADGKRIAFDTGGGAGAAMYVMNVDGTGLSYVGDGDRPQWSPDGTKLVAGGNGIEIVSLNGTGTTALTTTSSGTPYESGSIPTGGTYSAYDLNDIDPSWNPTGTQVVFTRDIIAYRFAANGYPLDPAQSLLLFGVNVDGTGMHQITGGPITTPSLGIDDMANWSPDGTSIAYRHGTYAGGNQIYVTPGSATGGVGVNHTNQPSPRSDQISFSTWSPQNKVTWAYQTAGAITLDGGQVVYTAPNGVCGISWGAAPLPKPPIASFTVNPGSREPGVYQFVSTSTDPAGEALDQRWTVSDGTTAQGPAFTHMFTTPGTYTATLSVTNTDGATASTQQSVLVKAPTLSVAHAVVDGPTNVTPGDVVKVDVTVAASADGVGDLTGVAWDPASPLGIVTVPADALAINSGPSPALPGTFAPGASVTMHFALQAGPDVGIKAIRSLVKASDAAGVVVHAEASANVKISNHALKVVITPAKDNFSLDPDPSGAPKPQTIDVTIAVTNTSPAPIGNVTIGQLRVDPADPSHPYHPMPAHTEDPNADTVQGAMVTGQKVTLHRKVTVTGDGILKLSSLVLSDDGAEFGASPLHVGLTTLLVEQIDGPGQILVVAGGSIVVKGTFKNVSNDRTVAITNPMKVLRDGNLLGGGFIARADGEWADDISAEPLTQILAPNESVPFQVRFNTARPSIADYDSGTASTPQWTEGHIGFGFPAKAAVKEPDDTWSSLTTETPSSTSRHPGSIKVEGGSFGNVNVVIDTTEETNASTVSRLTSTSYGLSLGALEDAQIHAADLGNLLLDTGSFVLSPEFRDQALTKVMKNDRVQASLAYLSEIVTWLPQASMAELEDIVAQRVHAVYAAFPYAIDGTPQVQVAGPDVLGPQIDSWVKHLQGAWRRGDPNELSQAVAPIGAPVGGLATDLVVPEALFGGLVSMLSTSGKYARVATAVWSDSRTIDAMAANLPSAAEETIRLKAARFSKSRYPALELAYDTRRPLTDLELGVGDGTNGAGLAKDTIETTRQWTKANPNQVIVLIPNEAKVAAARDAGLAVGKIESIKPKSMPSIEKLVFGGRDEDLNYVLLRNLKGWDAARVDARIDQLLADGLVAEDDRLVAHQILNDRNLEWARFKARGEVLTNPDGTVLLKDGRPVPKLDTTGQIVPDTEGIGKLAAYDEVGLIPNQFRGVDNGLRITGPEQAIPFKLEYLDEASGAGRAAADSDYVVVRQQQPISKKMVKVTGDDDGIFIGLLNGLGLPKSSIEGAYESVMSVFNHPFTDTWLAGLDKKLKIFSKYMTQIPGTTVEGAPLIQIVNGEAYAVKIDPFKTRFDPVSNRAFIAWEGAPAAVDPIGVSNAFVKALDSPVSPSLWPAALLRYFLHQTNAVDVPAPVIRNAKSARVIRINLSGHLETWAPTTGWRLDPVAETAATNWDLAVAPQTQVLGDTRPGDIRVEISSQAGQNMAGDWYAVGDQVVLDPGGPNEEFATIGAFGSLIFTSPMTKPHLAGEIVAYFGPGAPPAAAPVVGAGDSGAPPVSQVVATTLPLTGDDPRRAGLLGILLIACGAVLTTPNRRNTRRRRRGIVRS